MQPIEMIEQTFRLVNSHPEFPVTAEAFDGIKVSYDGKQAALGLNLLMLYTEDVYKIEGYPYFGYLHGRYTEQELKDIDDYALKRGIEVVPCIQTLAHLNCYFRWEETHAVMDLPDTLLADAPESYRLIDAMLQTCSRVFRSRRIHVGMDENRL